MFAKSRRARRIPWNAAAGTMDDWIGNFMLQTYGVTGLS
jgi:hypothetical protein